MRMNQEICMMGDLMQSSTQDQISVILRVRDEERWIGHAIQSCLDFINKPEIIIVNNKSKDQSIKISKLFKHDTSLDDVDQRYCDIKILDIDNYSPGKALNLGCEKATRPNLLIISSHCIIKKFDIDILLRKLNVYPAIFGKQVPYYFGKRLNHKYIWSHFGDEEKVNLFSNQEDRYFFHNAFSFIRRDYLNKFKFNENLVGKEDRYWINQLVNRGDSFLYSNQFICDHHFTQNGNTWSGVG